jgi:ribosomal protein L2
VDGTIVVKVVMPEKSLPQGIEGKVISAYTIKSIFDRIKKISGRIVTIEYDPNRNAYFCLMHYEDSEKRYILHSTIIGDTIIHGTEVPISMGNALPLNAV